MYSATMLPAGIGSGYVRIIVLLLCSPDGFHMLLGTSADLADTRPSACVLFVATRMQS
jgi:hypothetical protein